MTQAQPDMTGVRILQLNFASALTAAGGTIDVLPFPQGQSYQGNCNTTCAQSDAPFDDATAGRVTTEADTTPPVLSVPADITRDNDPGVCGANVSFTVTVTDDRGTAIVAVDPGHHLRTRRQR